MIKSANDSSASVTLSVNIVHKARGVARFRNVVKTHRRGARAANDLGNSPKAHRVLRRPGEHLVLPKEVFQARRSFHG